MSKKIFELKNLQRIDTFRDTPPKKKRYAFATSFGGCEDFEIQAASTSSSITALNSLVDPIWETIDPTPDLHSLFQQYDDTFFDGKLASCEVKWSTRMTSSAGLCSFEKKGRFCSIRLSKPLLQYRPRKDTVETLLHEMIHAFLFLSDGVVDHDGHGTMFQFHMHRINRRAGTNITVYHSFHNEVAYHQKHWWRCSGPCRMRSPFYGWIKRSMNRAPGATDFWWKEHQMTCGGIFIKVKEPEAYGMKKKVCGMSNCKSESQTWEAPLNRCFTEIGHVVGGPSSPSNDIKGYDCNVQKYASNFGNSRMKLENAENRCIKNDLRVQKIVSIDKKDTAAMPKNVSELLVKKKIIESIRGRNIESVDDDIIVCVSCPVCNACVPENTINSHLDLCLT